MGRKINSLGFRLGITRDHYSLWFAQSKKYFEGLQEDQKIRDCIKNYIQKNMKISSTVKGIARFHFEKQLKKAIEVTKQAYTKGIQKLHVLNEFEKVGFPTNHSSRNRLLFLCSPNYL
ncbi:hypothetical protein M9H77_07360 [Catharanthus roseus]|uniref:Uncharacterized protein n=1 Tax=Catharanthus roseus TaxID=4058 RepID=A0ACC0BUV9_CATRO|nr:hypothetical protein M9H77_07360 [Catharanthus roseus]